MATSKGTILITGINGYIASHIGSALLASGYTVRGTARRPSSADRLAKEAFASYTSSGKFEVVEVPDITVPGAFDSAVSGVQAILHTASPLSLSFTDPEPVLHAAVGGTKSILESAYRYAGPQLESVIMMSSIAAVKSTAQPPYTFTEKDWNDWAEEVVKEKGKESDGGAIYVASKAASEKAFWRFKGEKKPAWSMAALNPVFVIGPAVLPPKDAASVPATTQFIFDTFRGEPLPAPNGFLPQVVDVRDIAALTVNLISKPDRIDGERYIVSNAVSHPQAIADILRREFPEARGRIQEGTPGDGYEQGYGGDAETICLVDSSKAKRVLGREWIAYEKSVVDTAKSFEGLV